MKLKLTKYLLFFFVISGCGIFNHGTENSVSSLFNAIMPDSCDLNLLEDITEYRKNRMEFPDPPGISNMMDSLPKNCRESYDSIHISPYGLDSLDLFVVKLIENAEKKQSFFNKSYRVIFLNDSVRINVQYPSDIVVKRISKKGFNKPGKNKFGLKL